MKISDVISTVTCWKLKYVQIFSVSSHTMVGITRCLCEYKLHRTCSFRYDKKIIMRSSYVAGYFVSIWVINSMSLALHKKANRRIWIFGHYKHTRLYTLYMWHCYFYSCHTIDLLWCQVSHHLLLKSVWHGVPDNSNRVLCKNVNVSVTRLKKDDERDYNLISKIC
jgi:hypothetical protein